MYSLFTYLVNISVKFSKKSEYGLRALIELTKNYGHPITRQQIGQRQNVPVVFLEQILLRPLIADLRQPTSANSPISNHLCHTRCGAQHQVVPVALL